MLSDLSRTNDSIIKNINEINIEVISEIQKDLTSYDTRSLVFLVYDEGESATALERLTLLQRVSKEVDGNNLNMLHDWAVRAQTSATWKYVFLEALAICQLYSIIRKLGFDVSAVKSHYSPDNTMVSFHINPLKKILYHMCENMETNTLTILKKTLLSYEVDVAHCEAGELVFLKLLNQKFISFKSVKKLADIVERIPVLMNFASILRQIEGILEPAVTSRPSMASGEATRNKPTTSTPTDKRECLDKFDEGFDDVFRILDAEEKLLSLNLKSDREQIKDTYMIKNPQRVGVAYIINQERFYPSRKSSENQHKSFRPLDDRIGSTMDKIRLKNVLSAYKFEVITDDNLDSTEMFVNIKKIINYKVTNKDSILFILCILSHGIKGEVFAADSVSIKVEDIQNLLDSSEGKPVWGMPKVLIIQACQVVDDKPALTLVADGPGCDHLDRYQSLLLSDSPRLNYFLKKSDYLIFWATAPEYEAFRDEKKGSIFIQTLCYYIIKKGTREHVMDIFTKVNSTVKNLCTVSKKAQLPIFESTLGKKLYLCIPE